jgi:hypothetical protein
MALKSRLLSIPWLQKLGASVVEQPKVRYWLRLYNGYPVRFDYPYALTPRYGHGRPLHARLQALLDQPDYGPIVEELARHQDDFLRFEQTPRPGPEPAWRNGWLPPLDGMAIYALLAQRKPETYLEVGSGNSTRFAARAKRDHGLSTRLVSVDPHPRAEIDALCDEVVRAPLEDADLSRFSRLKAGDVVFIDNSRRALMSSDATAFFLDVLPSLPNGVIVGIHDIWLPHDYPPEWKYRYYNEQYLLAAMLLAERPGFEVLLPTFYLAASRPEMLQPLERMWRAGVDRQGGAFWLQINRQGPMPVN